jgi:hypothetical protein
VESDRNEFFLSAGDAAVSGPTHEPAGSRAEEKQVAASALAPSMHMIRVAGGIARIASPANGMVIPIDPDIPLRFQRVPLTARGADTRMVLRLNGNVIGAASDNVMWAPERGVHTLALEDSAGHTLDAARFIVR